jgi:glutamine amidotransferase
MCRWLAYYGAPRRIADFLYGLDHSLIHQSLHARSGSTTNGDGFGLGWYDDEGPPGLYRSVLPAWNNRNLRELAAHIRSPLFMAHVRASTGTPVQETNCHPFRRGRWLFMHNGAIRDHAVLRRSLLLAVDPDLFSSIEGSTDSELMFYLALTFGLGDEDPVPVLARMAGHVERTAAEHGIVAPLQMTVCLSNGSSVWAVRYASAGAPPSLYVSREARELRELHPRIEPLEYLSDEDRAIVSEPLIDLPGAWIPVREGTAVVIRAGPDQIVPFVPDKG